LIPSNYVGYFQTASQAAGALIGLLFVVIALKPGKVVGAHADPVTRKLAAGSFTGLVDAFFVSLLALIPGHHKIGIGAAILAVLSLFHTVMLRRGHPGIRSTVIFSVSLIAYGFQLYTAVALILHPAEVDLVEDLAFVLIGTFGVALSRAWQLLESTTVTAADQGHAAGPSSDGTDSGPS
jgi:hypothetical protein